MLTLFDWNVLLKMCKLYNARKSCRTVEHKHQIGCKGKGGGNVESENQGQLYIQ